jgi:putative PIN family toxin of toxin-antitoxin system
MTRERVVVDTNAVISGFLLPSSIPARAVDRVIRTGQLVGTSATLRELAVTWLTPKFERYVEYPRREALLQRLVAVLDVVEVLQPVRACRDPGDNMFLEAAVNGAAAIIVSGDRDLLVLHPFRGIAIVTPAAYLTR